MWILIDIAIIAFIAVIAIISAKKGFVRTAVEVLGFIAAIIIAVSLGAPVAGAIYNFAVEPAIVSAVENVAADGSEQVVDVVWEKIPDFITNNAEKIGVSKEHVDDIFMDEAALTVTEAATKASQEIARPIFAKAVGMFISAILFIILLIVVKIVAKLLNKLFSFSVVGSLNKILGAALGTVKGIVLAIIICSIITVLAVVSPNGFLVFNTELLESTFVFKFFADLMPLSF